MKSMGTSKEKPRTWPEKVVRSHHTPMWLYQCRKCKEYTSFSGIVINYGAILGMEHEGCGRFSPVEPFQISGWTPMSHATGDEPIEIWSGPNDEDYKIYGN